MPKRLCKCGTPLFYYKGGAYWYCPNVDCDTFTLHYDRYGNLVKETKTGFSLRRVSGSKTYDIIGEISK